MEIFDGNVRGSVIETFGANHSELQSHENDMDKKNGGVSLELLEQQQAKEQTRLLQRFLEMRVQQKLQQERLMQQQQQQIDMLQGEQLLVQTLLATNKNGKQCDELNLQNIKEASLLMTPPLRRSRSGLGTVSAIPPHLSNDSGVVSSISDTVDPVKASLPLPMMYQTLELQDGDEDSDRLTNPDLFSNPDSNDDGFVAVDEQLPLSDVWSDSSSCGNFHLSPLSHLDVDKQESENLSLKSFHMCLGSTGPDMLEQIIEQLPAQQKMLLIEQRQAAIQHSASPCFSNVDSDWLHRTEHLAIGAQCHRSTAVSRAPGSDRLSGNEATHHSQGGSRLPGLSNHRTVSSVKSVVASSDGQPCFSVITDQQGNREVIPGEDLQDCVYTVENSDTRSPGLCSKQSRSTSGSEHGNVKFGQRKSASGLEPGMSGLRQSVAEQPSKQLCSTSHGDYDFTSGPGHLEHFDLLVTNAEQCMEIGSEERPVRSGTCEQKTFDDLIEEHLSSEQVNEAQRGEMSRGTSEAVARRPFLRKGQGTARFLHPPKARHHNRPSTMKVVVEQSSGSLLSRSNRANTGCLGIHASRGISGHIDHGGRQTMGEKRKVLTADVQPPAEMLKLIKQRTMVSGRRQVVGEGRRQSDDTEDDGESVSVSSSFIAALKEREKWAPVEEEELDEFEVLEEIADNMSLVSDSSIVRQITTPNKQRQKSTVCELKNVLMKKKQNQSNPFVRNAAIQSLLSATAATSPHRSSASSSSLSSSCCPVAPLQPSSQAFAYRDEARLVSGLPNVTTDVCGVESGEALSEDVLVCDNRRLSTVYEEEHPGNCYHDPGSSEQCPANGLPPVDNRAIGCESLDSFLVYNRNSLHTGTGRGHYSASRCPAETEACVRDPVGGKRQLLNMKARKVAPLRSRLNAASHTAAVLRGMSARTGRLPDDLACDIEVGVAKEAGSSEVISTVGSVRIGCQCQTNYQSHDSEDDDDEGDVTITDSRVLENGAEWESDTETSTDSEATDNRNTLRCSAGVCGGKGEDGEAAMCDRINPLVTANGDSDVINVNNNRLVFDDEEEWLTKGVAPAEAITRASVVKTDDSPPTSRLMSKLFPKLGVKPALFQQQQQQNKIQHLSSTGGSNGVHSKVLIEKLSELEAEIERFRVENASLECLRKERVEGVRKLKGEISRFEQEKADELGRLNEYVASETKKLKQERKLFDTYQKQVRSMPDKRDREEMEVLQKQRNDLQDELKRKENRWALSATRLKTRVADVEAENAELKVEMKMLEQSRLDLLQMVNASTRRHMPPFANVTGAASVRSSEPTLTPTLQSTGNRSSAHFTLETCTVLAREVASSAIPRHSDCVGLARGDSVLPTSGESVPRESPLVTCSLADRNSPAAVADRNSSGPCAKPAVTVTGTDHRPAVVTSLADKGDGRFQERHFSDGKVERVYGNGSQEIIFANGTRKEMSPAGQHSTVLFFNGDIKQVFPDRVVYHYAGTRTTQETYPDGLEVIHFPNNQSEKHYPDGTHEITFPNQMVKCIFSDGMEESVFPDGTILRVDKSGERVLELPNGQREIHTDLLKRREYPDGTVKTLHNDGRQETRYSTGRVRIKDKDGNVLLDRMR